MINKRITLEAKDENLAPVNKMIENELEQAGASIKDIYQIEVAVEELFVNVCHYAYPEGTGDLTVDFTIDGPIMTFTLEDSGIPFDPVKKADPDITLPVEQRAIGGLGIFMVKKSMDDLRYKYEDGKNITTIEKRIL